MVQLQRLVLKQVFPVAKALARTFTIFMSYSSISRSPPKLRTASLHAQPALPLSSSRAPSGSSGPFRVRLQASPGSRRDLHAAGSPRHEAASTSLRTPPPRALPGQRERERAPSAGRSFRRSGHGRPHLSGSAPLTAASGPGQPVSVSCGDPQTRRRTHQRARCRPAPARETAPETGRACRGAAIGRPGFCALTASGPPPSTYTYSCTCQPIRRSS